MLSFLDNFASYRKVLGGKINATISEGEIWVFFYLIYFLSVSFSGYPYSRWNTGSAGGAVTSVLMNGHALFNIILFFTCLADKMIATHYSYGFILKTDEEGEDSRNVSLLFKQTP